jgi:hypothetical protein
MDSGLIVRPNGSAARTGATRRSGGPRNAAVTDLATSQTVTAAPNTDLVRDDTAHDEATELAKIILDAQSREVLYRTLDERSRGVTRQAPEAVARRLKAYARPDEETASPIGPRADFKV